MRSFRSMRRPVGVLTALMMALIGCFAIAGCVSSGETAVVTKRPEPTPSTEDAPAREATRVEATPAEASGLDTVRARRFDQGKMWTFENPPLDYFEQAYDFRPSDDWLRRVRLGALRFADYCSASFVSPRGLVMTNHHCGRESIAEASREGENLLEEGFYAETREGERKTGDLFVDQLIQIRDVTGEVEEATAEVESNEVEALAEARQRTATEMQERLTSEAEERDSSLHVRVVELYDGERYRAYTYRRYDDVRLVMAPELQLGFFGGTYDNFTYPRYALDVSFFRVYDEGEPLDGNTYFSWSRSGAEENSVVFAVGNPGSTSRLSTTEQLRYQRDFALPQRLDALERRAGLLEDYLEEHPEQSRAYELRGLYFSLQNALKATRGELQSLNDPYLIARRRAREEALLDSIAAIDSLGESYAQALRQLRQVQGAKRTAVRQAEAFTGFLNPQLSSHLLMRAFLGYYYDQVRRRPGVAEEQLEQIRSDALDIEDWPASLEEAYIAARLRQMREALGPDDPTVSRMLQGRTPEAIAEELASESALADSAGFAQLLEDGYLQSDDPSVPVIRPFASLFLEQYRQQQAFASSEQTLGARLAHARLAIYGNRVPPDASSSLRLADGRVEGYAYNGTRAPAHTTYFGLYDHYQSYREIPEAEAWDLPGQWLSPSSAFDRTTPFNLVSTNDIAGGNSGSPLLNKDLEIVGVVFDSNTEAFSNTFLYQDEAARAISVDVRGILEALEDIYEADRLVGEITGSIRSSSASVGTSPK